MRVLNIKPNDEVVIIDALDNVQFSYEGMLKSVQEEDMVETITKEVEYLKELKLRIKSLELQELAERCMSYFWDMYKEMDGFCDELEELREDMGLEESELVELFHMAGFTKEV